MQAPFSSHFITDTGISTGDEGKGRVILEIINELRDFYQNDAIVAGVMKVNGGSNSGHTVAGLKLNLLPGGVADPKVPHLIIGSGVVADPRKFLWESLYAESQGHPVLSRLKIDQRCLVSDLSHRLLDLAWEDFRVEQMNQPARGSTGRGITPAYLDEVGQFQIYYADFAGPKEYFFEKMSWRIERSLRTIQHVCRVQPEHWFEFFKRLEAAEIKAHAHLIESGKLSTEDFNFSQFIPVEGAPFTLDSEKLASVYWEAGQALLDTIDDIRELILKAKDEERFIIGEFGQAYWLDKRHGFSPNVTASHTFTPEFFQSAGIPVQAIHNIGCCKAYDTKGGTHTFLTEIESGHPLGNQLKKLEFGATTGRQRMVGWYDAVEKGDALRYGGFEDLALNKLDALSHSGDWQGDLKICVAYKDASGNHYHHVPRNDRLRKELSPVYKSLPGWSEDLSQVRKFSDLPTNAKNYVAWMLKSLTDIANFGDNHKTVFPKLRYIGVGPDPKQIIKDAPDTQDLIQGLN
ncbi:MAG: adenylosuccinate synthase [Puniceicoccaceae bacterium]|nr:adenylosuccinate synthase [Puniceicoccaceae bacterium]